MQIPMHVLRTYSFCIDVMCHVAFAPASSTSVCTTTNAKYICEAANEKECSSGNENWHIPSKNVLLFKGNRPATGTAQLLATISSDIRGVSVVSVEMTYN